MTEVKGKDFTDLIATGREKLASVPSGGGASVAVAASAGPAAAPAAAEAKKEEKKEEKEESEDEVNIFPFTVLRQKLGLKFQSLVFRFSYLFF